MKVFQDKTYDSAVDYFQMGSAKANLGQYEAAIVDYDTAIRLTPDYTLVYCIRVVARGVAKVELGLYESAITDYDTVIHLRPDYTPAYHYREVAKSKLSTMLSHQEAVAYYKQGLNKAALGQYEEAISDYNAAIQLRPDYVHAYYNRGLAKVQLGQYEEAISDYDTTIDLKSDFQDARDHREKIWHVILINSHPNNKSVDYKKYLKSKAWFEKRETFFDQFGRLCACGQPATELHHKTYDNIGQENLSDLVGLCKFCHETMLSHQEAVAYYKQGLNKAALGQYEEAISDYDAAIQLRPDYVHAYYNRGLAKVQLGQYEEAISDYDTAIDLKSDFQDARDHREKIWHVILINSHPNNKSVDYKKYLKSKAWFEKRETFFDQFGRLCACGQPATELHHKTYDNIGQENLSDLVGLCKFCHQDIHHHQKRFEVILGDNQNPNIEILDDTEEFDSEWEPFPF